MTRRILATLTVLATLLVACGTRVPDETFERLAAAAQGQPLNPTESPGPGLDPGEPGPATPAPTDAAPGPGQPMGGPAGPRNGSGPDPTTAPTSNPQDDGGGPREPNTASDVGVTPTSIKVGLLFSRSGPLGPSVFSPPAEGAAAYFNWLNRNGGVNGRRVEVVQCDDAENPEINRQCVNHLVNEEKVFALVASSTRAYAGARDLSAAGVPDVGGQPIGNEYWTYPTLYTIRGSEYPRDGSVGYLGQLWGQTTQFRWSKENLGITNVGVVHYDIPVSASYGDFQRKAASAEGLAVSTYRMNAAFPNFDTVVSQMQSAGVDAIWDTLDFVGNQKLCEAMQRKGFQVKLKMTTSQGMTRTVGDRFPQICREVLHAWVESRPMSDNHPELRLFRETVRSIYGAAYERDLHQWALEGWLAAKLFVTGVEEMGANVTREGLMSWLESFPTMHDSSRPLSQTFQLGGLLSPLDFQTIPQDRTPFKRECLIVTKWDDDRRDFLAVTTIPYCRDNIPWIGYEPAV